MHKSFVYFAANDVSCWLGHTDAGKQRPANHAKYGFDLVAVIPASSRCEKRLHNYFIQHRQPIDGCSSRYEKPPLLAYANKLLDMRFAAKTFDEAMFCSEVDYSVWSPDSPLIVSYAYHADQAMLFATDQYRIDVRDEYETPENVLNACRNCLGQIDLDPCSNAEANKRVCAASFYTKDINGLRLPWRGSVFMNPPYGGGSGPKLPLAAQFCEKLVEEMKAGNVTQAITVLNLQSMPTKWFPPLVWKNASAHAVWNSRIDFIRPRTKTGSKPFASSKNGTIISYFGAHIERFRSVFGNHMVFTT